MLVLTRTVEQRIVIAGNIVVKVLNINGGRVKIGVEAPADISVFRGELLDAQDRRR
jgi:carbon storage regulator